MHAPRARSRGCPSAPQSLPCLVGAPCARARLAHLTDGKPIRGGYTWSVYPLVAACSRCQVRHGLGPLGVSVPLAKMRHGLLPTGWTNPSALPTQCLGVRYLTKSAPPVALQRACCRAYGPKRRLLVRSASSIPGSRRPITEVRFRPAKRRGLARPHWPICAQFRALMVLDSRGFATRGASKSRIVKIRALKLAPFEPGPFFSSFSGRSESGHPRTYLLLDRRARVTLYHLQVIACL